MTASSTAGRPPRLFSALSASSNTRRCCLSADMPESLHPRALVVGGGPGGSVAAIRAGPFRPHTGLVDSERPGGTCLLRGCIPSKALIHAADQFFDIAGAA